MPPTPLSPTPRKTRSDALQNREHLLEVAARVFAERGVDIAPAAIAKEAGVGVGTLYRHFPTREALIVAAHHRQLTLVHEKSADLAARFPASEATRTWIRHFLDFAAATSGMCTALNAVITADANPYADSHSLLTEAVTALLDAGAHDGTLRTDVTADDVLLLVGSLTCTVQHTTPEQRLRIVDLLMDALTKTATAI